MKKILLTLTILAMSHFTYGQTLDSLQGTWRFESVYHTANETIDSAQDERVGKMFESLAYQFKANSKIVLSMFDKEEEGTFEFKPKKNTIIVNSGGRKVMLEILAFEGSRMAIKFSEMQFWVKLE